MAEAAVSREHVEAVLHTIDAWNRGDLEAFLKFAHPDVEWSSEIVQRLEGTASVYRGPDGLRRYWEDWHGLWNVKVDVDDTRDLGETVLVLATVRAHGGASGIDVDSPIAYLFRFADGLCRSVRAYFDVDEALRDA